MPIIIKRPLVAQLVEQLPLKETVLGSSPSEGTRNNVFQKIYADVAKLVDALVLGTSGAILGGSSPLIRTQKTLDKSSVFSYFPSLVYII